MVHALKMDVESCFGRFCRRISSSLEAIDESGLFPIRDLSQSVLLDAAFLGVRACVYACGVCVRGAYKFF